MGISAMVYDLFWPTDITSNLGLEVQSKRWLLVVYLKKNQSRSRRQENEEKAAAN